MSADEIKEAKAAHPDAKVLVHPECNPDIIKLADYIGSTSGIINYAKEHKEEKEFIIGTVVGVIYKLEEERPDAAFYFPKTEPVCINMDKITLDHVIHVLETGENEVSLPPKEHEEKAKEALHQMLLLAK